MDRGAWWATVHGVTELDMTELTQHLIKKKERENKSDNIKALMLFVWKQPAGTVDMAHVTSPSAPRVIRVPQTLR